MKKYSKFIWFTVFLLIVLSVFFNWEDFTSGFREGYHSIPK